VNKLAKLNYSKLQIRRGSTAWWNENDPILFDGEPAIEFSDSEIKLKIGDGKTNWKNLKYVSDYSNTDKFVIEAVKNIGIQEDSDGNIVFDKPIISNYDIEIPQTTGETADNYAVTKKYVDDADDGIIEYVNNGSYGHASGKMIFIDDASSVKHEMKVSLSSDTISDFSNINVLKLEKNLATAQQVYSAAGSYEETTLDGRTCVKFVDNESSEYGALQFKQDTQYTVSFDAKCLLHSDNTAGSSMLFRFFYTDGTNTTIVTNSNTDWRKYTLTSLAGKTISSIGLSSYNYVNYNYIDVNTFQLEEGASVTEFEPYKGQIVIANSDGTVDGLYSSPKMIIMSNNNGSVPSDYDVIIDCEYLNKRYTSIDEYHLKSTYLPLSGGKLTGPVSWKDEVSLPESPSLPFVLGITRFADGGQTQFQKTSDLSVGSATKATQDGSGRNIVNTYAVNSYGTGGGFVGGTLADLITGGGGAAVGNSSKTDNGGAVGLRSFSSSGGAIGFEAYTQTGGAVGQDARSEMAGFAGGEGANTIVSPDGVFDGNGGAIGKHASTEAGGSAGENACSNEGGAVGLDSTTTNGGAVGYEATSGTGGAVGSGTSAASGGAVGESAISLNGGAVGNGAETSDGFAGGLNAKTVDSNNEGIDAIQLGTGTNLAAKTFQVYGYQMMDASGNIPAERIPIDNLGCARIATGSYTGTGTSGESGKNTLTFAFQPKIVFITCGGGKVCNVRLSPLIFGSPYAYGDYQNGTSQQQMFELNLEWDGNSVSWYSSDSALGAKYQHNETIAEYYYVAIG
jgi:hypothetical protein